MRKGILLALLVGFSIGFFACKDCEPVSQPGNELLVQFYRLDSLLDNGSKIALDTSFQKVAGLGIDSVLYSIEDTVSSFVLPLSSFAENSTFVLESVGSQYDTMSFSYILNVTSEGPDCGFFESFEEIQLLNSTFDSAQIVTTFIALGDEVHLEIYE